MSIPHSKASTVGPAFVGDRRREVNDALQQFAAGSSECCIYHDLDILWERGSTDFEADGLHLSKSGYGRFASLLASSSQIGDFIHSSDARRTDVTVAHGPFGPVAMHRVRLSDELLQYLLLDGIHTCAPSALGGRGFDACVDYPHILGHAYWEGYYHASLHSGAVTSVHPRKGRDFEKPAAPLRLRAFLAAVRSVNSEWFEQLAAAAGLPDFEALLKDGRAFSDVAVQVHHGTAITEEDARYHMDGINSCLHLALSLKGARSLLCQLADQPSDTPTTRSFDFSAGDVYVSCPWAFPHGVAYPQCDWDSRIVAVQCRLLFSLEEERQLHSHPDLARRLLPAITEAIAGGTLRMPSLLDVEAEVARLSSDQASKGSASGSGFGQTIVSWGSHLSQQLANTFERLRPPPVMDTSALAELGRFHRKE